MPARGVVPGGRPGVGAGCLPPCKHRACLLARSCSISPADFRTFRIFGHFEFFRLFSGLCLFVAILGLSRFSAEFGTLSVFDVTQHHHHQTPVYHGKPVGCFLSPRQLFGLCYFPTFSGLSHFSSYFGTYFRTLSFFHFFSGLSRFF